MNTDQFDLEDYFRSLAREEAARVYEALKGAPPPSDAEAADYRRRVERVLAKKFVSIGEAALLLNCSDSYIRKLVKRAQKRESKYPIPFTDLDGHVVFELGRLLDWADQSKPKRRADG